MAANDAGIGQNWITGSMAEFTQEILAFECPHSANHFIVFQAELVTIHETLNGLRAH